MNRKKGHLESEKSGEKKIMETRMKNLNVQLNKHCISTLGMLKTKDL